MSGFVQIFTFLCVFLCPQRALLEQKQRRKRQEPLMVQPNSEGRPRRSRPRRSEEQAPLVETQVSTASDIILDGEVNTRDLLRAPSQHSSLCVSKWIFKKLNFHRTKNIVSVRTEGQNKPNIIWINVDVALFTSVLPSSVLLRYHLFNSFCFSYLFLETCICCLSFTLSGKVFWSLTCLVFHGQTK